MIQIFFEREKCVGCHSCVFACAIEHSKSKDPASALLENPRPIPRRKMIVAKGRYRTVACQHCKKPACVEACPNDAFVKEKSGEVKLLVQKCAGTWACIEACPFDAIWRGPGHAVKCDMCPDRPDGEFACVKACPTGALVAATPEDHKKMGKKKKSARK